MKKKTTKIACAILSAVMAISCASAVNFSGGGAAPFMFDVSAATISLNAVGWRESAWVEWNGINDSNIAAYVVSYQKSGESSFTKIDTQLIRSYGDGHWRADIVGLSAGTYTVKVEAVNSSSAVLHTGTSQVSVTSHDRTGFAFSPQSYFDKDSLACGAYNADGTPRSGAEVIYITKASDIDSVTDSTGTVGLSNILMAREKRTTKPLIVRIIGKIEYSGSQLNSSGYIQVKPAKAGVNSQITIEGVGADTTLNFGFLLRYAGNVELRNFAVHDFGDDGVSLDTKNYDIWVHNCEFFYGVRGSGDKAKGDGSTDVKNDSQYVTISYNHYWDGGKVSLCGMKGESGDNFITYHHNWFDHSDSRHPRIRTMSVHVFNNYYDGNSKYGVGASEGSNAFVESNYFRNSKYPTLQGSTGNDNDGSGGSVVLEDSNPIGAIKLWNNEISLISGSKWATDPAGTKIGTHDGYAASSRSEVLDYTTEAGAKYNNFDTSNSYVQSLASVIQTPTAARDTVVQYAGRQGGGDFAAASGFAFNNSVDDASYNISESLRTALTNYYEDNSISNKYKIASVGGAVDPNFVPVTEETTEAQETLTEETTEATTEKQAEPTTAAPISDTKVKISYDNGYTFTGSGTLTDDASYGGAYGGAVSGTAPNTTINATSKNYVDISNGSATVVDTDSNVTSNLVLPIPAVTSGTVTITGTMTPSIATTNWALFQVFGADNEIAAIRINGDGLYGLRVNAGSTVYPTTVKTNAGTQVSYKMVINMTDKKASLSMNNGTEVEASFAGTQADTIKFVTATKERNITVGNVSVAIDGGTTPEPAYSKGDINLDGTVDALDVSLALQYLVGGTTLTADRIAIGDIDGDGKLTIKDAYLIKTGRIN